MVKAIWRKARKIIPVLTVVLFGAVLPALAQEEITAADAMFTVNNVWMMVSTFLVFIMHLGFATLESGLTRAKNTVNILFKNTLIISIGLLTYAFCGFNLMYPGDAWVFGNWLGFAGFGVTSPEGAAGLIEYADGAYTYWTDFLFQGMFAATGATIISGAVAGRIKLRSFLLFTAVFVGFLYPWVGSWKWGGGWLDQMGFYDFAGSTLVHSVGGWGALAGAIILGPRLGKYIEGQAQAMPGSNMPLATIGVFLLWLGWFGFNGGSVLSADPGAVSYVLVTTCLAAAAGILGAWIVSEWVQKEPDLSMALNGCLAGLVGITAGADVVSVTSAIIIGLIAGGLVVYSVVFIDRVLKIDDPVGAISVHLVCGMWGTLAVGLFANAPESAGVGVLFGGGMKLFWTQLLGIFAYGVTTLAFAVVLFLAVRALMGLRVPADEEVKGLDIGEHGMEAYSGFQIFLTD